MALAKSRPIVTAAFSEPELVTVSPPFVALANVAKKFPVVWSLNVIKLLSDVAPVPPWSIGRALVSSRESILLPPVTRSPPPERLSPLASDDVAVPDMKFAVGEVPIWIVDVACRAWTDVVPEMSAPP